MDTDYEKRLNEVLNEAFDRPPGERAAFLEEACQGDERLLQDALSYVGDQPKIGDFLERPAIEAITDSHEVPLDSSGGASIKTPVSGSLATGPSPNPRLGRPSKIGPYELMDILGEGGMGVVYRAEDTRLRRPVAIKFLARNLLSDKVAKSRFLREARAASKIDHPNTCTIHEISETEDGQPYIVMAYYEGESLKERLEEGALDVEEATRIFREVGAGLARIHRAEIIHRDVKPGNVFITDEGPIKILDFGIAKAAEDSILTRKGRLIGTPGYMSPEQIRGEADNRSDIWALAILFFEMLSGKRPFHRVGFKEELRAIVREPVPSIAHELPGAPPNVIRVLSRALVKEPNDRYQNIDQMLADLDGAVTETTAAMPKRRRAEDASAPEDHAVTATWRRWLTPFLTGLLLAGAAMAGGCWLLQGSP